MQKIERGSNFALCHLSTFEGIALSYSVATLTMLALTFSDVRTKCPDVLKMVKVKIWSDMMQSYFRPMHGMVPDISITPRCGPATAEQAFMFCHVV